MEIGLKLLQTGEYYPLARTRIIIGSHQDCDIVVESTEVAPRHAEIRVSQVGIEVDDLNSGIGTLVNDFPIDQHFLSNRDVLTLGAATFALEFHTNRGNKLGSCERCGVQLDHRMTRSISQSLLSANSPRMICDRCSRKEMQGGAAPPSRRHSSSLYRRMSNFEDSTQSFNSFPSS